MDGCRVAPRGVLYVGIWTNLAGKKLNLPVTPLKSFKALNPFRIVCLLHQAVLQPPAWPNWVTLSAHTRQLLDCIVFWLVGWLVDRRGSAGSAGARHYPHTA